MRRASDRATFSLIALRLMQCFWELSLLEIPVSIFVAVVIVAIYRRYRTLFCLPFFWAAVFALLYLGMLQIRAEDGGSSFYSAAAAFGLFYVGLIGFDLIPFFRRMLNKTEAKPGNKPPDQGSPGNGSRARRKPAGTRIDLIFPVLPLNIALFLSLT